MKCHYDVLGVEKNADDEAIKKAYRKRALQWHPDKNPHRIDEATEQFRLVQAAYDVLIDPQERAWYNRHRDEILHKSEFASFKDETIDLFQFFTPSAYKGFGEDSNGFYSVYGNVFETISEEDQKFSMEDSEDSVPLPKFGDAESDYNEEVHPFYAAWQAYNTKMSYIWIEKYDAHDAPGRRVARLIEKENKKERDKERKKRNEIVRDLVGFVRKRDPRVKAYKEQLELRALEQEERAEAKRAEFFLSRIEDAALYEEQNQEVHREHEERVSQLEEMMKEEFGFSTDEDTSNEEAGSDDDELLYCVACNKQFKTTKAFKNHSKSKAHKVNVMKLQAEMKDEVASGEVPDSKHDDEEEVTGQAAPKLSKRQKKKKRQQKKLFGEISDEEAVEPLPFTSPDPPLPFTSPDPPLSDLSPTEDPATAARSGDPSVEETNIPESNVSNEINTSSNDKQTKKNRRSKQKKARTNPGSLPNPPSDPHELINYCTTCRNEFPSRNKLFQHLKTSGHSIPLESSSSKNKKGKRR